MKRVCIGIHVHTEPERLMATLTSIRANTPPQVELLVLGDGPDPATTAALATLTDLPQSTTEEPRGAAACFNRLASLSDADVLVLLESGSLVAPGWLDCLLEALDDDPLNGLAGPTTNYSWNEQGGFPYSGASTDELARTARQAARQFGTEARTLEPLYSLSDFCYVVRREVVERIGAADEGYGLGPCWEMDYNIRAARAGFRGVWACAAYVHRAPFTARRMIEEASRFEASKHRYQDKFCGARLRGEKSDYRSHCRGDACPNFAPRELMKIHEPLDKTHSITTTAKTNADECSAKIEVQMETD
jgi:GT2 family glycosyltransferase